MLIDFSDQFKKGISAAGNIKVGGKFERVIFCGMGGSAIPGEIVSMLWLPELNCYINRGYGLPGWVDDKCLVICSSWSGDTEETLSSWHEARSRKLTAIALGKGGKLEQAAGSLFIKVPGDSVPARYGVGYMLAAMLTLLNNSAIIDITVPNGSKTALSGKDFSSRIGDKLPLIYSSYQWRYLARFWKIHFNENSKVHSFSNFMPEAAHNEINGYTPANKDAGFPIILIDPDDDKNDIKKLKKFAAFLKNEDIDHEIVEIEGGDRFEKILNNYNRAIAVSVGLAKIKNVEPFDTSIIEQFKKA